ncbi:MAG: FkbM family methyltransferase [Minisyncoccota bacterium]
MEDKVTQEQKALLVYSKNHFDPSVNRETAASAGIIAKSLYETLFRSGFSVDYLDYSEIGKINGKYDLFIGHLSNWLAASKKSQAKTKILFMPTTHPLNRNKLIRKYSKLWKEPAEEFLPINGDVIKTFSEADFVLQIGNEYAIKALLENGVPLKKILHIHYGINYLNNENIPQKDINNFIYLAAGLGLRKGLPKVMEIFSNKLFSEKKLTVVGTIYESRNKKYWEDKLVVFLRNNPNSIYLGFIKSDTKEYKEVIDKNSWLIFPTIEEGEPGTALEAMSRGVVPIMDMEGSGINFNIGGPKNTSIDEQMSLVQKITQEEWEILSEKSQKYISLFHDHKMWEERLTEIFSLIKTGDLDNIKYPQVSIVLSVFNKENSIQELLSDLWRYTKSYPNWELHIIFDGCVDDTKTLAKNILQSFKVPVYEYETLNIFETKSNNLGLQKSKGKYCVLLQDDNFLSEKYWLEKMVDFMEERPKVAVLGGLAGVNFFKLDSSATDLNKTFFEAHKRIDWRTDKGTFDLVQEVDAVMRGPIVLRKANLEKFGYLDEIYAPFYDDDMDYCFRMKKLGFGVFYFPIMVENRNLTIANYNKEKRNFWEKTMQKNSKVFYSRWQNLMEEHSTHLTLPKPDWHKKINPIMGIKKNYNLVQEYMSFDTKRTIKRGLENLLTKMPANFIMSLTTTLKKIGGKISNLGKKVFLHKFQKRTLPWHAINGDNTLRINYDLDQDSVVFDVGGYMGQWFHEISAIYGSTIHVFEPVQKFANIIQYKYKNNGKIIINNYGLSDQNTKLKMSFDGNSSSQFKDGAENNEVEVVRAIDYIHKHNIKKIDLIKINIEGGEYDLLEHLINEDFIKNIDNIQVQFHDFVPNAEVRMRSIQKELRKTHELTYQYEFVWENWKLKK